VELFEQIRREYELGGVKIRALARKFGVHRRVVRQALASAVPPARQLPHRERPKLAPVKEFIDAILEGDRKSPRKQRHTAHSFGLPSLCIHLHPDVTIRHWSRAA
jgi:hypothetical protein